MTGDSRLTEVIHNIYLFQDTCNVYIIKDGDSAILIDFGRGDVIEHLQDIGVHQVDWILHTHHHREQCQGDVRANRMGIRIGVPRHEAGLFNNAEHYWNHLFQKEGHVLGAPFVRPLRSSIQIERTLDHGDIVEFGDTPITVIDTPGNSPGSISFQLNMHGQIIIFVGDLLMKHGQLINLYDCEWDYGYCSGLKATVRSCQQLINLSPDILLSSHGEPVANGSQECQMFAARLGDMIEKDYLRDWTNSEDEIFISSVVTAPSIIDEVDVISPHLLRWKGSFGSLYMILDDHGSALMVDAGIILYHDPNREQFFVNRMDQLMHHYGIQKIHAVMLSHYHGDHLDIYPCLRRCYGTELWCYENMIDIIEHPERFNLMALLPSYGIVDALSVDRILHEGECVNWGCYQFSIFHLPGQTYYAMGISGTIDDVFTVFTGDNVFYSEHGSGHDAFALRNRAILEEGYLKCAETLMQLKPHRLLSGHTVLIDEPHQQIERLYQWAVSFRQRLESFSPYVDYEWMVDPYWAEFHPYQLLVQVGTTSRRMSIKVRNHNSHTSVISGTICCPVGWIVTPHSFDVEMGPKCQTQVDFSIQFSQFENPGRYPVTVDISVDHHDFGELFDAVVEIRA